MQTEDQILPFLLQALSQKPKFCETFDNLCKDLESNCSIREKYQKAAIPNLVESAVKIGQNLGIVTLNHDLIRMPFKFFSKSNHSLAPNLRKEEQKIDTTTTNESKSTTTNENNNANANTNTPSNPDIKVSNEQSMEINSDRIKVKARLPRIRKVCGNSKRPHSRKSSTSKKRSRRAISRSRSRRPSKSQSRSRKCRR